MNNFVLILTLTRAGSAPAMMQLHFSTEAMMKEVMQRIVDNWATNPHEPMMIVDNVGAHTMRPVDILATSATSHMKMAAAQPGNQFIR